MNLTGKRQFSKHRETDKDDIPVSVALLRWHRRPACRPEVSVVVVQSVMLSAESPAEMTAAGR